MSSGNSDITVSLEIIPPVVPLRSCATCSHVEKRREEADGWYCQRLMCYTVQAVGEQKECGRDLKYYNKAQPAELLKEAEMIPEDRRIGAFKRIWIFFFGE